MFKKFALFMDRNFNKMVEKFALFMDRNFNKMVTVTVAILFIFLFYNILNDFRPKTEGKIILNKIMEQNYNVLIVKDQNNNFFIIDNNYNRIEVRPLKGKEYF